jgi:SAM-dependent methyltransferase
MQIHQSDQTVLKSRSLAQNHRRLAELLKPGQRVLDVGCGTGSITAGIAQIVGPSGRVLGIDQDSEHIASAQRQFGHLAGLRFETSDLMDLETTDRYDVVTASRTVQWIRDSQAALLKMAKLTTVGGCVCVLDYDHDRHHWHPHPGGQFATFQNAFLAWRQSNGLRNDLGRSLPDLLDSVGLHDIIQSGQDEYSQRGDSNFAQLGGIWLSVLDVIGPRMVDAGFITDEGLRDARLRYHFWLEHEGKSIRLILFAAVGFQRAA